MEKDDIKDLLNPNNEKEKILENAILKIKGNIILSDNHFIQIKNITQIWKGKIEKQKLPLKNIIISTIIALLIIAILKTNFIGILISLIILGFNAFTIYKILNQTIYYGLHIELNSGNSYFFKSSQQDFLSDVFNVLINVIRDGNIKTEYLINFGSGSIINKSENISIR